MTESLYVGIDVAKDSFDVASLPAGLHASLPNDPAGRRQLLDTLRPHPVALIVLEATGGYERDLVADLLEAGLKASPMSRKGQSHAPRSDRSRP